MLRLLIRLVGIVVMVMVVQALVQWVLGLARRPSSSTQPTGPTEPTLPASVETRRDPMCGTYVATTQSVKALVRGHEEHFCSSACRDKYLAA